MEFKKKKEKQKRSQDEMKVDLRNPVVQLENSKESLTSRENHAEYRVPGLRDNIDNVVQTSKKMKN